MPGYASSDLGQNQPNARSLASNPFQSGYRDRDKIGANQNGRFEIVMNPRNSSVTDEGPSITVDYARSLSESM